MRRRVSNEMDAMEHAGGVILREGFQCAYFVPSEMRLFSLQAPETMPLSEIAALVSARYPASRTRGNNLAPGDREALFPVLTDEPALNDGTLKPRLGRLTLNISNICNMACVYCYADQGNYHTQEKLMTGLAVRQILTRVLALYSEIAVVHFFGGEPLMNLNAIYEAGEFLQEAVAAGELRRMPKFALTTNGTWSNPEVIETLKHWKISLTVSWDGTRKAQDTCRPMRSGASSYELLANTLLRFDEAGIPYEIECTYNGYHKKNGISIVDLMNFFHEKTGKRILHIAPAFVPRPQGNDVKSWEYVDLEALAEDYRAAARLSVENMLRGEGPILQFAYRVAEHLATQTPARTYCPAFFTQLTIATDGSVYPCFILAGDRTYRMGNMLDGSFPGNEAVRVVRRYFEEFRARPVHWYSVLSEGCVAGEALASGSMTHEVMGPIQQAIAEECVLRLASSISSLSQEESEVESPIYKEES